MSKVSPALAVRLEHAAGDEWLDVVVAVRSSDHPTANPISGTRAERIAAMRREFAEDSRPVLHVIERLGGRVVETIWLNQSLAVRLRASQIPELQMIDSVLSVDLAQPLAREHQAH